MSVMTSAPSATSSVRVSRGPRRGLRIDCSSDHRCLRAASRFEAGETVLILEGMLGAQPSRYSVQVALDLHVHPAPGIPEDSVRAAWRFLNHSCAPNSRFEGPRLVATTTIEPDDEITFNYNTTEAEMAEPFTCRCGHCDGQLVRGYRHLSKQDRQRIRAFTAAYLLASNL